MLFFIAIALPVVLLDQLTKWLVQANMPLMTGKPIIAGLFNLIHVRNTGGAFSIFAEADPTVRRIVFIGLNVVVMGIIAYAYSKTRREDTWLRTAYVFICGGALGNVIDRIRFGSVVDFLDFYVGTYHWPAFNVADMAISAGAIMLCIALLRGK